VTLAARWLDQRGRERPGRRTVLHLPWDVAPGETVRARPVLSPPQGGGARMLVVGVVQDGVWFDGVATRCFTHVGAGIPCPAPWLEWIAPAR
jgi:hypothetical protein